MQPNTRRRLLGWSAVAAQFAAIGAILWATRSVPPPPAWMTWLGLALMLGGLALMLAAFLSLGSALTPTPVPNGRGVVATGVYRWVRHPIYVGLAVTMLGVVVRSPGVWPLLWWVVLVGILVTKSAWEERMLAAQHPEYHEYRNATSRFLPRRQD